MSIPSRKTGSVSFLPTFIRQQIPATSVPIVQRHSRSGSINPVPNPPISNRKTGCILSELPPQYLSDVPMADAYSLFRAVCPRYFAKRKTVV
jgi:hypothetical protein